jgi:hypothetical protein
MPVAHQPLTAVIGELSAWQSSKAATSASTACDSSALAPLRNTSVSGSANVPGWQSWKTLLSVTAYHSFGGEVGASNTPRYAASTFMPSPTFANSSLRQFGADRNDYVNGRNSPQLLDLA